MANTKLIATEAGVRQADHRHYIAEVDKFPLSDTSPDHENQEAKAFGFYVQKGLFEEYAEFGRGHGPGDLAVRHTYHGRAGCAWPVVNGTSCRFFAELRPIRGGGGGGRRRSVPGAHLSLAWAARPPDDHGFIKATGSR